MLCMAFGIQIFLPRDVALRKMLCPGLYSAHTQINSWGCGPATCWVAGRRSLKSRGKNSTDNPEVENAHMNTHADWNIIQSCKLVWRQFSTLHF